MYFTLQALCGSEHNLAIDGEYQLNVCNCDFPTNVRTIEKTLGIIIACYLACDRLARLLN